MKTLNKKELVKLLSYIVMGDGGLYYPSKRTPNSNAKFIMNMKKENSDYILMCKEIIEQLTNCYIYERKDYNTDGCTRQPQLRIESSRHPLLTTIHSRVYTEKYKGLDPHALKMLDAEALAILYMCDGSYGTVNPEDTNRGSISVEHRVTLNMKRLSYGDQFILKKALKDLLDLEWNINRQNQYYYLRLRTKDIDKFMELVAPHVLPSFQYKLKECFRTVSP